MGYEKSIEYLDRIASSGRDSKFEFTIEKNLHSYIYGYCGIYAAALLKRHPDWTLVAVGSNYCRLDQQEWECSQYGEGFCDCHLDHFYVVDGDGWYYDAYGQHDPSALHDHVTVSRPVSDDVFRCVLELWYDVGEYEIAQWALDLTTI